MKVKMEFYYRMPKPANREYLAMKYEDENIQLACALKSAEEFIIADICRFY